VAQIKNQNPLNPADGIEFVSQLAQFSQLEQMMQIRSELETIRKALEQNQAADSSAQPPVPNP
jgi:flagellar basal-body rod modification protein FlgD